ncbi:flagellar assembly protein FliH [Sulfurimonas aquatica]|uniref:Flagellar assembly protein FliH n=1 Tax=Sulfurimonas aquatica TaxID=2672570 RepID=A0A975B1M3_9BACT|nr:flagellar assembly protein FliH [Sulfurimonas aquatica]QSZ42450.1 flagellar assembly protein FliH [Sulfurimonas aquatica]
MASIIPNDSIESHSVDKYKFKVISSAPKSTSSNGEEINGGYTKEYHPKARASDIDSSALSSSSKESLIESLMQKTDEMSSNFIKLQMKLEAKEEEYKKQLEIAKEEAYAEGMEVGAAKALKDIERSGNSSMELFASSVAKLEHSATEFESALEGIKSELISAALDISQEVIKVEIANNSSEIAKVLSEELIKELQSASKITLKVNPKNHGSLSESLGKLGHIEIVSDSAISEGGVVVMSDAGNIDAQVSKRFQRVKKAALSE